MNARFLLDALLPDFLPDFSQADPLLKDAQGKPLLFLHGTTEHFEKFAHTKGTGRGEDPVYYFTRNPDYAGVYAQDMGKGAGSIHMVYLTARRIFDTTRPADMRLVKKALKQDRMEPWEVKAYLEDYFIDGLPHWENSDMTILAQKGGYGGIRIAERRGIESIGIFDPEDIVHAYAPPVSKAGLTQRQSAATTRRK